jgi:hypothetical protein
VAATRIQDILVLTDGQTWETLPELAAELNIRISAVLVGNASLDANIGHLCVLTGGELFYVPDAEVGASVRLALNSKRSVIARREIQQTEGRPSAVKHGFGGVEIAAIWSDAMEIGSGTDFGRFAAWLCLGQMDSGEAKALALREGLCTQATSLVLIDEAGAASDGISETRKISLMAPPEARLSAYVDSTAIMPLARETRTPKQLSTSASPRFGISMLDARPLGKDSEGPMRPLSPEQIVAAKVSPAIRRTIGNIWPSRSILAWLDDELTEPSGELKAHKQTEAYLRGVAEGVDWDMCVNDFLAHDFSGLLQEEGLVLKVMTTDDAIQATLAKSDLNPQLLILAYLAARFVNHSRAAQRFAKRVLSQVSGLDFVAEIDAHVFVSTKKDR